MGLDQFATARQGEAKRDEDGYVYYEDSKELARWRKHPNLEGWMANLYYEKGGEDEFNCVDLELDEEDLDELEYALNSKELPETSGFFFGSNSDDQYAEQDREFIVKARAALKEGYDVVYHSWW